MLPKEDTKLFVTGFAAFNDASRDKELILRKQWLLSHHDEINSWPKLLIKDKKVEIYHYSCLMPRAILRYSRVWTIIYGDIKVQSLFLELKRGVHHHQKRTPTRNCPRRHPLPIILAPLPKHPMPWGLLLHQYRSNTSYEWANYHKGLYLCPFSLESEQLRQAR